MHTSERSDKQKAASRHNGAKSHGPVTPAGKQQSAAHTSRHAVLARTILLPGESRERFNTLYLSFVDDLLPTTPVELALVEKMAVAHWKQMRMWAIERACLNAQTLATPHVSADSDNDSQKDLPENDSDPDADRRPEKDTAASHLADTQSHNPDRHALALVDPARFATLIRAYETNCDRVFSRSLDRILKLRAARQRANEIQPPEPGN